MANDTTLGIRLSTELLEQLQRKGNEIFPSFDAGVSTLVRAAINAWIQPRDPGIVEVHMPENLSAPAMLEFWNSLIQAQSGSKDEEVRRLFAAVIEAFSDQFLVALRAARALLPE